ncbi:hypothetical protein [Alkaliphilus transvaalensis]|uniref:hypothetical protein n=1 Tax=Alkaliphilus transvaalensis TaxID=114628 RepID=UPI00047E73BE|nr:hypothetical protein [Alkaliphilus transvaalensis]
MDVKLGLIFSILGLMLLALIFLGLWTYRDAKSRGLNAGLWVVIVLLVPNLLGLLLYFLIGRKESPRECPECGSKMSDTQYVKPVGHKSNKGLLVGFVTCLLIMIILALLFFGSMLMSDFRTSSSRSVGIGLVQNNIGSQWKVSFRSLSGGLNSKLTIRDGSPEKLNIKTELESGSLTLTLRQGDKSITIPLDHSTEIQQDLKEFKNGTLQLKIEASNAKGGKVNIWW